MGAYFPISGAAIAYCLLPTASFHRVRIRPGVGDRQDEVDALIDDWMDYYNTDRGQWDLRKLTPKEYFEYLQTGVYPLPVYSRGSAPDPEV